MQKYQKGDLVRVAKNLRQSMSHFESDVDAIVMYSYAEKYCGDDTKSYCIHIKGRGEVAWYYENQLALIEKGRLDLLDVWQRERDAEIAQKSDLDWIFANGEDVLESPHGASVAALAKCFGLNDMWGRNGEGITYYSNMLATIALAEPFLKLGDKAGWLAQCADPTAPAPTV